MKKIAAIIIMLLSMIMSVNAQVSVFNTMTLSEEKNMMAPCASIFVYQPLSGSKKIGITYFALLTEGWGEFQIGASYAPTNWLSVGLSTGFEQSPKLARAGASIFVGNKKVSFLTLLEKGLGEGNYWYKSTISYNSEKFTIGARAWRFQGIGPVVEYNTTKKIVGWVMPAYEHEAKKINLLIGIDVKI